MLTSPTLEVRLSACPSKTILHGKPDSCPSLIFTVPNPNGLLKASVLGKYLLGLLIGCLAVTGLSQATDEDAFIGELHSPAEKSLGQGQSALWTLPDIATQYHPLNPTVAMKEALQAQQEGRFLDALIRLDDASKSEPVGADVQVEITLLYSGPHSQDNNASSLRG